MPVYEKRYKRNGVPMPIQCLRMKQCKTMSSIVFHYHDYIELLYGVSGMAHVYVGAESYSLTEGSLILIRNNEPHEVTGNGETSRYIVVKFLPSLLFSEEQTFFEYCYALLLMQKSDDRRIFFSAKELENTPVRSLLLHMMEEWESEQFGYEFALRADVTSTVMHIMRKWQESDPQIAEVSVSMSQSALIQSVLSYVGEHYADLTEESCAAALGVSPSYLSRTFKKGMKNSFTSYLNSVKLKEAEKLLLSGDESMTEIALRVGFSSVAYFIATFRARYRISPNQYRKLLRGNAENDTL